VGEFDRDLDRFEEGREDFGFALFSVLDEDGVVHLKEKLRKTRPPNLKHPSIEYIAQRFPADRKQRLHGGWQPRSASQKTTSFFP
jgi:hypothetical protein